MPTETIYQPPDGEGPSVVRETRMTCNGCLYFRIVPWPSARHRVFCEHPDVQMERIESDTTPSWCPIVSAAPEEWAMRMKT